MSIKDRLTTWGKNLGLIEDPFPDDLLCVSTKQMAFRVRNEGGHVYNGYRLLGFGYDPIRQRPHMDTSNRPVITSVSFLECGEGNEPTIYIYANDEPSGTYPCHLDETVILLLPDHKPGE